MTKFPPSISKGYMYSAIKVVGCFNLEAAVVLGSDLVRWMENSNGSIHASGGAGGRGLWGFRMAHGSGS